MSDVIKSIPPHVYLNEMADAIERFGWQRGHYGDEREGFCTLGASSYVQSANHAAISSWSDAMAVLQASTGCLNIAGWNDRDDMTKEKVVAALRKAAQAALTEEV